MIIKRRGDWRSKTIRLTKIEALDQIIKDDTREGKKATASTKGMAFEENVSKS